MRIAKVLGFSVVIAAVAGVGPTWAEGEPPAESRSYSCVFETGSAWGYGKGAFETKAAEPLKFEITDIDLEGQSAHLTADGKKRSEAPLKIVRAINANHFLEVVNEGFLNLTTVYDKDPATGQHPAVHSRHFGVVGEPVFAQYAGFCTDK
jgi:hypothetical protein